MKKKKKGCVAGKFQSQTLAAGTDVYSKFKSSAPVSTSHDLELNFKDFPEL